MKITTSVPFPSPSPAPSIIHHHHHGHHHHQSPQAVLTATLLQPPPPPPPQSKLPVDFSPPLIAMVVIVAAAFLVVTYSRLISRHLLPPLVSFIERFRRRHRRRRPPSSVGEIDSPPFGSSAFHALSAYGLDDSAIKTIPISIFTKSESFSDKLMKDSSCCAVCLLEFEDNDYVRTLPVCSHAFHVDCIDVWLRSQANCPLCRAGIFVTDSPFIPLMASRIRPSFDDSLLLMNNFISLNHDNSISPVRSFSTVTEITPCIDESPRRITNLINSSTEERRFDDHNYNNNGMLLKRSYSFGFERSLAADRMLAMEPATTSPWRYRRNSGVGGGGGGFWSKRLSPFTKSRVFSFRQYRGGGTNMKYSPFFNRRRGGMSFFPLSERFSNLSGGGGGSSRRSKSMTSPMFMRSSASAFSSSRLRCGDPEALLSPERYNRR